jgi:type II secretory ATPase GspE/PulE/Tfp pilus assembly ATPase PilB-like protein
MGWSKIPEGAILYKAVGCPNCSNSGYSGRTVIHELMVVDDKLRSLIVRKSDAGAIKKQALENGMLNLREDGVRKVCAGITTIDELMRATHAEE